MGGRAQDAPHDARAGDARGAESSHRRVEAHDAWDHSSEK